MAGSLLCLIIGCFLTGSLANPVTDEKPLFRTDYTYIPDVKLFLKEHPTPTKWSDAVAICSAEGSSMFTPITEAEANAALLFKKKNTENIWLGMHDMFSEGDFATLDGTYLSEIYSNWDSGEPNNYNNEEDCATFSSDGKYNDVPCFRQFGFVCAKKQEHLEGYNHLCDSYDTEYVYSSIADRCYKMHTDPKTWHAAFKTCKAEQSQLAVINSEQEAAVLVDLVAKCPLETLPGNFDKENIFLGFNDLISNGHFTTVKGKSLRNSGYEVWTTGQPDNFKNEEHCGAMLRDGKLSDRNCMNIATFICEKTLKDAANVETLQRFGDLE